MEEHEEWDKLNAGKSYIDYMKEENKKMAPIRKARMDAAKDARAARKKKGINIGITKPRKDINSNNWDARKV